MENTENTEKATKKNNGWPALGLRVGETLCPLRQRCRYCAPSAVRTLRISSFLRVLRGSIFSSLRYFESISCDHPGSQRSKSRHPCLHFSTRGGESCDRYNKDRRRAAHRNDAARPDPRRNHHARVHRGECVLRP